MSKSKSSVPTRERILRTSAELFRRRGYPGTGLKQISRDSGAPFGSVYHFFPGGKEQIAAESLRIAGDGYRQLVEAVFDASPDVATGVYNVFIGAGETLRQTNYEDACPIATVAADVASTNDALRRVMDEIFESWFAAGTKKLQEAGLPEDTARELIIFAVAALEGAFILSRTARNVDAMAIAGRAVSDAVARALAEIS